MQLGNSQNGILTPSIPYVIPLSDFLKLYPIFQKMAQALVQTGKVRIVDDSQPSTVSSSQPPSTDPPRKCLPVAALEGRYHIRPPRRRKSFLPEFGDSHVTQARREDGGGGEPAGLAPLGNYRLIRNGTTEERIEGVS